MKPLTVLSATILFFLSACASPTDLRGGKADIDVMTDKPAERVAGCVGDKFEGQMSSFSSVRSSTRPTSNGYTIVVDQTAGLMSGSDTLYVVDIDRIDNKTHVIMFDHVLTGSGQWVALVRACL